MENKIFAIVRNFILDEIPDLTGYTVIDMEQTYLMIQPEIRVRKENNKYVMTVKSNDILIREEYETVISKSMYESLKENAVTNILYKTRYMKDIYEIDIYTYPEDLHIVEVEFNSLEEANSFIPPKWFGEEVTYNKEFFNKNLAIIMREKE